MAETLRFDFKEWDRPILSVLAGLSRKTDLLTKVFNVIGIRNLVKHFTDEMGPDGKWQNRSPKTDRQYFQIFHRGRLNADLKKKFKNLGTAYASGQRVYRSDVGGIPRSAFRVTNKILQLTGNLRKTMLKPTVEQIDNSTIRVSSTSPYGAAHDEGDSKKNLPKREFMWVDDKAKEAMVDAIADTLFKGKLY